MALEEQKRDQEWKDLPWHYPLALLLQELELELVLRLEPLALLFQELELELVLRLEPLALLLQELELELVLRLEPLALLFQELELELVLPLLLSGQSSVSSVSTNPSPSSSRVLSQISTAD